MRRIAPPAATIALSTVLLAACAHAAGVFETDRSAAVGVVAWDVVPVVWTAADVFERLDIPVAVADEGGGVIESGTFRVEKYWAGAPIEARVTCPVVPGSSPDEIYARPFQVTMAVRTRRLGAASTEFSVSGFAEAATGQPGTAERVRCEVSRGFRQLIVREIRRELEGLAAARRGASGTLP